MNAKFEWDGNFWVRPVTLPFRDVQVQIRVNTDSPSDQPTQRQIDVANLVVASLADLKPALDEHAANYCREIDEDVDLAGENIHIDYDSIGQHWSVNSVVIGDLESCSGDYYFLSVSYTHLTLPTILLV